MITIRPGRAEDRDWMAASQVAMARETEGLALDPATVAKGVKAVLDDPTKGSYWIAEREGRRAGMLLTIPEWSDWRNGTVLWIHSVWVEPADRRAGIYRALYRHLVARVEASPGLRGLRLYVDRTNTKAQAVYESLGMDGQHYRLYEWMKAPAPGGAGAG